MGRMITYATIGSLIALSVHSGQALAQARESVTPTQVSLLMDRLAKKGLETEQVNQHTPLRTEVVPVCERTCETKFVRGYESCAAVFEKLSQKTPASDNQQAANMCGRAALSGLKICRTDCQTASEAGATLTD
ncbi:MAG: hypothetical protein AAF926_05665 [Pseudomonadota bacterium]